ncbi:MAG: hypothetical protein E7363_02090 [Clostridiales bacterium]|nr:hypothetical protein [Clostridiales bacterium]
MKNTATQSGGGIFSDQNRLVRKKIRSIKPQLLCGFFFGFFIVGVKDTGN